MLLRLAVRLRSPVRPRVVRRLRTAHELHSYNSTHGISLHENTLFYVAFWICREERKKINCML